MSFDNVNVSFVSTNIGNLITLNSCVLYQTSFYGSGGWVLQDNLVVYNQFYQDNGTFDANNHNVTASDYYFYADTGYTPTVIMGSGTWEVTGSGDVWYIEQYSGEYVTITPETSTIKLSNGDSSDKNFSNYDDEAVEEGKSYNNIVMTGTGTGGFVFIGSNTFNDFKVDTPPHIIYFELGTTTTVSSFTVSGEVGNLITLVGVYYLHEGSQFTLSKSSGTVSCDYLDISDSNATSGATWIATNSVDTTNNTGWQFPVNTTLTPIDAGTTTLLAPTITEGSGASTTLSPLALITTLSAMSVVGDANTTFNPVEAGSMTVTTPTITEGLGVDTTLDLMDSGSVTIPDVDVGIYQRVFLGTLALSTSLYEPNISVERNWREQTNEETNWDNSVVVTTDWTSYNDSSSTWTPVDTLKQS